MGPFQKIDEQIETQVKKLEAEDKIPRLSDLLPDLDDEVIKYLNYGLNFLAVLVPLGITLFVFSFNSAKRDQIKQYQEIMSGLQDYNRFKTSLGQLESKIVSPFSISDANNLKSSYSTSLATGTKTRGEISIENFEKNSKSPTLFKSLGTLKFSNFSQRELSNVLRKMIFDQKMKINDFQISKDPSNSQLRGKFDFEHFGKN
ncbi:MAG: hypothetical protein ACPGJV_11050 [Bacteriovoracaceae bacterium]